MNNKFVAFEAYCKTCKHKDLDGWKDPCNECLTVGGREYTQKPLRYEYDEKEAKNAR